MPYPLMVPLEQRLYHRIIADPEAGAREELRRAGLSDRVGPGDRIAVTAGSRGIREIAAVLRGVAREIESLGASPFLVPAMGSHGGATAEGQIELLAALGVTEETIGAPVRSRMETETIGQTADGFRVFLDRNALDADGIVVVNRIKPHTDFRGKTESGLTKMLAIGLGKKDQAEEVHSMGTLGLREVIPSVAGVIREKTPVRMGLAILENGYGGVAELMAISPDDIPAVEPRLLARAKRHSARIPFDEIDILLIDWIGKEISGAGLDTNVIGRLRLGSEPWMKKPRIQTIVLHDLTDASHGNAVGTGLGDIITRRITDKMDRGVTLTNLMISTFVERGAIPPVYADDRAALDAALYLHRSKSPGDLRIVRIRSTLHLDRIEVSEALLASGVPRRCTIAGAPMPFRFDANGNFA